MNFSFLQNKDLLSAVTLHIERLAIKNLCAVLTLAIAALLENDTADRFQYVYDEGDIKKLFTKDAIPDIYTLAMFYLLRIIVNVRKQDIKNAYYYYELNIATRHMSWFLSFVQLELCEGMQKVFEAGEKVDQRSEKTEPVSM